jgi:hypothetical protein
MQVPLCSFRGLRSFSSRLGFKKPPPYETLSLLPPLASPRTFKSSLAIHHEMHGIQLEDVEYGTKDIATRI